MLEYSAVDFVNTTYQCGHHHLKDVRSIMFDTEREYVVVIDKEAEVGFDVCPKCACAEQNDKAKLNKLTVEENLALGDLKEIMEMGLCKKLDLNTGKLLSVTSRGEIEFDTSKSNKWLKKVKKALRSR